MAKRNNKKLNASIFLGTTLAAAAGLATALALVHELDSKNENFVKDKNIYQALQQQVVDTKKQLADNKNLDANNVDNINDLVKRAEELIKQKNSDINTMYQLKNELVDKVAKAQFESVVKDTNATTDQVDAALNNLSNLIKDKELKVLVKPLYEKVKADSDSFDFTKFYSNFDGMVNSSNKSTWDLEKEFYHLIENNIYDNSFLKNSTDKANVFSAIDTIRTNLNAKNLTKDYLQTLNSIFANVLNTAATNIDESMQSLSTANLEGINTKLNSLIDEINASQLQKDSKDKFIKEVSDFKEAILNSYALVPANNLSAQSDVSDFINTEFSKISANFLTDEELKKSAQTLQNSYQENKDNYGIFSSQVEKLITSVDTSSVNVETYIKMLDNSFLISTANRYSQKLKQLLTNAKDNHSISSDDFDKYINNELLTQNVENLGEFVKKLSDLYNSLATSISYNEQLINQLEVLEKQVKVSYQNLKYTKLDSENQTRIQNLKDKLSKYLAQSHTISENEKALAELTEEERQINKEELKGWVTTLSKLKDSIVDETEKQNVQNWLDKWQLNDVFLVATLYDGSTRQELQQDIAWAQDVYIYQRVKIKKDDVQSYADVTKEKVVDVFGEKWSKGKEILLTQISTLRNDADRVDSDKTLSVEQKEEQLQKIYQEIKAINDNAENFHKLDTIYPVAQNTISNLPESLKIELGEEIKNIEKLLSRAKEDFDNPQNSDPVDTYERLQRAIEDFNEKKKQFDVNSIYKPTLQAIKDAFVPTRYSSEPTAIEKTFLDKLEALKTAYLATEDTDEREKIKNQMLTMQKSAPQAANLELALQALQSTYNNSASSVNKNGENYPELKQAYNKAQELLQTYSNGADFNKDNINEASEYNQIQAQIDEANKNLQIQVALAELKNEAANLAKSLYTGDNKNLEPYASVNNSIQALLDQKDQLLANPDATVEQIQEMTEKLARQQKLANKLNDALSCLDAIDKETNPVAWQKFADTINEPLVNDGDNALQIQEKINNLNEELSKSNSYIEAENAINQLKSVYNDAEKNKAIYSAPANELEQKINKLSESLNNEPITISELKNLKVEAVKELRKRNSEKDQITSDFAKAKSDIEAKYNDLVNDAKAKDIVNGSEAVVPKLNALYEQYQQLKDADSTTQQQLDDIYNQMNYQYQNDLFDFQKQLAQQKLDELSQSPYSESPLAQETKQKLQEYLNSIDNHVQSLQVGDEKEIANETERLKNLVSLVDTQKKVFDRIKDLKDNPPTDVTITPDYLEQSIRDNTPSAADNTTTEQLKTEKQNLENALIDSLSLEEAKRQEAQKINTAKKDFDNSINLSETDQDYKDAIDALFDQLSQENTDANTTADVKVVDTKLNDLVGRLEKTRSLAKVVKKASDLITNTGTQNLSEAEQEAVQKLQQKIAEAKTKYGSDSATEADVFELSEQINELLDKLRSSTNLRQKYASVKEKLATITYPQGSNNFGTPDAKKQEVQNYIDQLLKQSEASDTTNEEVTRITLEMNKFSNLFDKQIEKIAVQSSIKDEILYQTNKFDIDTTNMADAILRSVPKYALSGQKLQESNINDLASDLDDMFVSLNEIYQTRKEVANVIINTPNENLIDKTKAALKQESSEDVEAKYQDLQTAMVNYFTSQLEKTKSINFVNPAVVPQQNNFDNVINKLLDVKKSSNNAFGVLSLYKDIADSIAKAQEEITSVESNDDIKNNPKVVEQLKVLKGDASVNPAVKGLIEKGKETYAKDFVNLNLRTRNTEILNAIAKLKIIAAYATALNQLNTNNSLSEEEKTPIRDILENIFTLLANDSTLENEEGYNSLRQKYIESSGPYSYTTAINATTQLKNIIADAQNWYNQKDVNAQTPAIQGLFTELGTAIEKAKVNTTKTIATAKSENTQNMTTDQVIALLNSNKEESINKISDPFDGLIAKLKKTKESEARNLYDESKSLFSFMTLQGIETLDSISNDPFSSMNNVQIQDTDKFNAISENFNEATTKYQQNLSWLYESSWSRIYWEHKWLKQFIDSINNAGTANTAQDWQNLQKSQVLESMNMTEQDLKSFNTYLNSFSFDLEQKPDETHTAKGTDLFANYRSNIINNYVPVQKALESQIKNLWSKFVITTPPLLAQYNDFANEIKSHLSDDSNSTYFTQVLKNIDRYSEIENLITAFANSDTSSSETAWANYQNSPFAFSKYKFTFDKATVKEDQSDASNKVNESMNGWITTVANIWKRHEKFNDMVYGTSSNEDVSLKNIFATYVDARVDLIPFLKNIVVRKIGGKVFGPQWDWASNDAFLIATNSYKSVAKSTYDFKNLLITKWNKDSMSLADSIYSIYKAYKSTHTLWKWLEEPTNLDLFYSPVKYQYNSEDSYWGGIALADSNTLAETFIQKLNDIPTSQNTFIKDGKVYEYKEINNQTAFINLFRWFPVVKTPVNFLDELETYNVNNVKVWIYKEQSEENFAKVILQSDTSTKKVSFNIRISYTPADYEQNSVFKDVPPFWIDLKTQLLTFKTLDVSTLTKENFSSPDAMENASLFTMNEAGWNKYTAVPNYLAAYLKYSYYDLLKRKIKSFASYSTLGSSEGRDDVNNKQNENFEVKFKFKDDFRLNIEGYKYKQYVRPNGDAIIYWAPMETKFKVEGSIYKYSYYIDIMVPMVEENQTVSETEVPRVAIYNLHTFVGGSIDTSSNENFSFKLGYSKQSSGNGLEGNEWRAFWPKQSSTRSQKTITLSDGTQKTINTNIEANSLTLALNEGKENGLIKYIPEIYARRAAETITGRADRLRSIWDSSWDKGTWWDGAIYLNGDYYPGDPKFVEVVETINIKMKLH
ncbi:hypothetical protein [Mycoplasma sp. 3341]|uniref:hypothetical protein n=1 Tax=Mycoplasma sp. 3341 TaxID=3447506 RepID=UPI003F660328